MSDKSENIKAVEWNVNDKVRKFIKKMYTEIIVENV